jgi:hypothetical protein
LRDLSFETRIVSQDIDADLDALVAYEHSGACNELANVVLALLAEGARRLLGLARNSISLVVLQAEHFAPRTVCPTLEISCEAPFWPGFVSFISLLGSFAFK